jgi:hypothetical protein
MASTLRLFDPDRRPSNWTDIIQPGQYVVFSQLIETGASCDAQGQRFDSVEHVTCLLFDALDPARAFCQAQVQRAPQLRFEIFDATGRASGPLIVITHPSRTARLEGNPRGMRIRYRAAVALLIAAVALFWYDYRNGRGILIFPTVIGVNLIVAAARLIQLNVSYAHSERERQQRLAEHVNGSRGT